MHEKKKQHFVPKCLLKRFVDEDNKFYLFNKITRQKHNKVHYANQCYNNYLYGKDKQIENWLATIEQNATNIFNKIEAKDLLNEVELIELKKFIFLQSLRVPKVFDNCNNNIQQTKLNILDELYKSGYITLQEYFAQRGKDKDNKIINEIMTDAKENVCSFQDLEVAILTNADNNFIVSDNPVNAFNIYSRNNGLGYQNAGLITLMPISPHTIVLLYDAQMYDIINKQVELNDDEVQFINLMQTLKAKELIFCLSEDALNKVIKGFENIDEFLAIVVKQCMYGMLGKFLKLKEEFDEYKDNNNAVFSRNYKLNEIPVKFILWNPELAQLIYKYTEAKLQLK